MLRRIRAKLNHSTVVAYLALFVALSGGTAWAVNEWNGSNILDESLTGADVQGVDGTPTTAGANGSLTGADISGQPAIVASGQPFVKGSLTGSDVLDGTLLGPDLKANTLNGTQINESSLAKVPAASTADSALNANTLGGITPGGFVQGGVAVPCCSAPSTGKSYFNLVSVQPGAIAQFLDIPGLLHVDGQCGTGTPKVAITNVTGNANGVGVMYDRTNSAPTSDTLNSGTSLNYSNTTTYRWTLQAGVGANLFNGQKLVTIQLFATPRSGDCLFQVSAILQTT